MMRPGRGLRAWVGLFLQERREKRAAGQAPAAPVITGSSWVWDATQANWADITLNFSFDPGTFPVGIFELWMGRESMDPPALVGTVASTATSFVHVQATQMQEFLFYQLRYVGGGVVGPFANLTIIPWHPLTAPSSLTAVGDSGGSAVLNWDMTAVNYEFGCSVEGRTGSNAFAELATTGQDVGSWMGGVASGNWEFRVRAFHDGGFSDYSNTATATVT